MNNCSRWQYWLRRLLHTGTQQRDRDGDRREARFRAALPHVLGVSFGFAIMLIAGSAGVAALLLTYRYIAASIKWARQPRYLADSAHSVTWAYGPIGTFGFRPRECVIGFTTSATAITSNSVSRRSIGCTARCLELMAGENSRTYGQRSGSRWRRG
jgi:hypothetical protein